ncbi:peptidylprolyl isomerase [Bacteroides sp.]|uniref:peptidylprolyl isomerase n=1 Tax=Bacteroides sp. TaxID=29523 RepID=UPI00260A7D8F|nr:peptidylprolyl isomerase [Bacteroides sp.]MDD3039445.1 peptidylprolyl isomerase [Bacteroides sp.]
MKKFINFRFVVILVLAIFVNMETYAQDNVIDEVVWVVGDEAILKSDVEEARMDALYKQRKFDGDPYCIIPEEIAVQKLFLHQAKLDSIEVSESEIIQRTDGLLNYYIDQLGSREKMEEYFFENQNKTPNQIREALRDNARDGITVQKMQQKLVGEIKITPSEVRRYFKDLPSDSIPYIPTQVEVQIITLQPKIPVSEIEDVKKKLREYTDRITKGEIDFSTLARLYSEDKGTAYRGGEMEFMGRGMLEPSYANVAFSLQDPKKVSKIVETEFGYHIIQLIEKRGDRIKTRHILLKPKVADKELLEACARLDSVADQIRNNKFSFDDAAAVISHDKDTRNNHGIMVNINENTGVTTSKFEMQDLPQDVAKIVDQMNVGEVSKAFPMINEKDGREVCAIVKLKAKINGHKATIAEDYQDLRDIVMAKRREEVLHKWILEKQRHTYVRINENWQKCDFKYPGWIKKD